MLEIHCPFCGPRAEVEFTYGGEGGIVRPPAPDALSDAQWADYLFMRRNPKGVHDEQWRHASGCGKWFHARRDTVSHRFLDTWKIADAQPQAPAQHAWAAPDAGATGTPGGPGAGR